MFIRFERLGKNVDTYEEANRIVWEDWGCKDDPMFSSQESFLAWTEVDENQCRWLLAEIA